MIRKTGDWQRARELVRRLPHAAPRALRRAVLQEAHALRKSIVEGLTKQAPGGESIRPPAELTLAARRLAGFTGTKALIRRADLRNAIAVIDSGAEIFVGIPRSATSQDGTSLVYVARVQEFGSEPIIIPITPAMRRFLAVLYRAAGRELPRDGAGRGVVVVEVPPRPFIRPAVATFLPGLERRLARRVAEALRLPGGR